MILYILSCPLSCLNNNIVIVSTKQTRIIRQTLLLHQLQTVGDSWSRDERTTARTKTDQSIIVHLLWVLHMYVWSCFSCSSFFIRLNNLLSVMVITIKNKSRLLCNIFVRRENAICSPIAVQLLLLQLLYFRQLNNIYICRVIIFTLLCFHRQRRLSLSTG